MKFAISCVFAVWSAAFVCRADEMCFDIPAARSVPVVDGAISSGEYDEGIRFAGLAKSSPEPLLVPGSDGFVSLLCDRKTLYVAWRLKARNIDVGGGLRASATKRDGSVWEDDSVELVVAGDDPDRIAHFIVNPIGTVYDSLSPRTGKADVQWNCRNVKVASVVRAGWWEMEMSVPLSSIGDFKSGILVNAAKVAPGIGSSSLTAAKAHIHGPKIRLSIKDGAPAVHMDGIGAPMEGRWNPALRVTSASADKRYRADILIREIDSKGDDGKVLLVDNKVLGKGDRMEVAFNTRSRSEMRLEAVVRDADSGKKVFERTFYARRGARTESIPPTAEFDLGEQAEVSAFYYPGMNKVRFNVFASPDCRIDAASCVIDGATVAMSKKDGVFTVMADVSPAEGMHPVSFSLEGDFGKCHFGNVWSFEKCGFAWENEGETIGRERIVLPPFHSIRKNGTSVSVMMREYDIGEAGLPRSVKALGRELLASPAVFEAIVEGRRVVFAGSAPTVAVANDGYDAEFAAEAFAAGMKLHVKGRFEYDGFQWNEYTIYGLGGRTLDRLTMLLPLKNAEMPLMHICTADSIRSNPTGRVPSGEGVVWDGTKLYRATGYLDDMFAPQTVPYVWLGAERRGISWFLNNTCGFKLDARKPAVRIVREKGTLRMEADVVNRPVRLVDGHAFAFGFEATPVKTPDKSMRRHFKNSVGKRPDGWIMRLAVRGDGCGMWNEWAHTPYNNDWELFAAACRHISTGKHRKEYERLFTVHTNRYDGDLEKYCSVLPNVGKATHFRWRKSCRNYSFNMIRNISEPAYPYRYSDPTLSWMDDLSIGKYKSEWISRNTGYTAARRCFLTPSRINYLLYCLRKENQSGVKGIYFDDMFPMTCRNPDTCAKIDDEGRVHGNLGILEMRELVKRAAVMQHVAGVKPRVMQVHMTNCLLIPSFAFATSQLSWEDHYGEDEFQKRFDIDYVRAESLGSQLGAESVALDGIQRLKCDPKEWKHARLRFLTRTQQAVLLPAGVKTSMRPWIPGDGLHEKEFFKILEVLGAFEIWADDCEFVPFYENDGAVSGESEGVLVGTYRRKGKTLAIFGNQTGRDMKFGLRTDPVKLGLRTPVSYVNAETGEPVPGGVLELPAYDLRMVLVNGR